MNALFTYDNFLIVLVASIVVSMIYMAYEIGYLRGRLKELNEICENYSEEARLWEELMVDVGVKLAANKESLNA